MIPKPAYLVFGQSRPRVRPKGLCSNHAHGRTRIRRRTGSKTAVDFRGRREWSPVRSLEGRRPWQDRWML